MKFETLFCSEQEVKDYIKSCEGKHIQQIAYSSYHNALTQICFNCQRIRTSIIKDELNQAMLNDKSRELCECKHSRKEHGNNGCYKDVGIKGLSCACDCKKFQLLEKSEGENK